MCGKPPVRLVFLKDHIDSWSSMREFWGKSGACAFHRSATLVDEAPIIQTQTRPVKRVINAKAFFTKFFRIMSARPKKSRHQRLFQPR
jgi:hypothetical protein